MNKQQTLEFFAPVMSRAELEGVVPDADIGYAQDWSRKEDGLRLFVYANGRWTDHSLLVDEVESYVRRGGDIDIVMPDGAIVPGIFSMVNDRPMAFPLTFPKERRPNYSERFYTHQM